MRLWLVMAHTDMCGLKHRFVEAFSSAEAMYEAMERWPQWKGGEWTIWPASGCVRQ